MSDANDTGIEIKIAWEIVEDVSAGLGEYVDEPEEWVVDRKEGWLLGHYTAETRQIQCGDFLEAGKRMLSCGGRVVAVDKGDADWYYGHVDNVVEADLDLDANMLTVAVEGYQVVRSGLSKPYTRSTFRYFKPGVAKDVQENEPDEGEIQAIVDDYERQESFSRDWWYEECHVRVLLSGMAVGEACSYLIESDAEGFEKEALAREAASQAIERARQFLLEAVSARDSLVARLGELAVEYKEAWRGREG
jgi:hypothetical protein